MMPQQFIAKWREAQLSERSAYQQHFCDLCDLLGQPKPADADRDGAWYTFERGVTKTDGENGWADIWMRGHFGWEYKGKRKNLKEAYKQLLQYREDLENPPLLVVCDLERFEIHTNFPNTSKVVHAFYWPSSTSRSTWKRCAGCLPTRTPSSLASPPKASPSRQPSGSACWPTACACAASSRSVPLSS